MRVILYFLNKTNTCLISETAEQIVIKFGVVGRHEKLFREHKFS